MQGLRLLLPMPRRFILCVVSCLVLSLLTVLPSVAASYLTDTSDDDPLTIALRYVHGQADKLQMAQGDLTELQLQYRYVSQHNGITHLFFKQYLHGIEVINGDLNVNVDRQGRILHVGDRLVRGLHTKATARGATLLPEQAVARASEHLGLSPDKAAGLTVLESSSGPMPSARLEGGDLSQEDIPVGLRYYADEAGRVALVWDLAMRLFDEQHWWNVWVDATSGEVLGKSNWIDDDSYTVFALPKESPDDGPRSVALNPADALASPFGWHDTNGVAGAEFTDTRGNNVRAQDDIDGNNVGGTRPDGGPSLVFDFPLDLTMQPGTYLPAAITNLFYWNNILHDLFYYYGFDEASGNFQTFNYTGAPGAGDAVIADAQDGSGTNNANFATPPDGFAPRMQMFIWTPPPTLTINAPAGIAGDYTAGSASFGAALTGVGVGGIVEQANDGVGTTSDACEPLVGFTAGRVALIDRGSCEFGIKVLNAENAGAVAAIVVNNQGDGVISMGPGVNGGSVTISSVFIGQTDGGTIQANLAAPVDVTLRAASTVNRDSDLDNGIIAHEYGHGVSNRLTGGRLNVNCLNNNEQAGEGWSDWFGLIFTASTSDTPAAPRGIGNYVIFEPTTGAGIRNFPYSTDLAVNPQTYANIGSTNIPHGVGEIWASMLWEMYWRMVERDGFSKDFYDGTGGNNLALQLSMDGLKLQACSPGFVDARDAILAADLANYNGANECVIWKAFAKRGLGASALQGSSLVVGDETEAFDIPAACQGFVLSDPVPGVAGVENRFNATGASPNQKIQLLAARQTGTTTVNIGSCGPVTFGLDQLVRFGREGSTQFGDVAVESKIAGTLSGQTIHFQMFDNASCAVSNVVSYTFP